MRAGALYRYKGGTADKDYSSLTEEILSGIFRVISECTQAGEAGAAGQYTAAKTEGVEQLYMPAAGARSAA